MKGLRCKANQTYLSCGRLLCLRGRLWEARVVGSRMTWGFDFGMLYMVQDDGDLGMVYLIEDDLKI